MTFTSPLPDVEISDLPLTPYVMRHADRLADKPALVEGHTGRTLTYGELDDQIRRFAGGLAARGFGKGDVVALLAPNCPEFAVAFLGTALAGCIVTTFNPTYTEREIHHQLTDSGATILFTIPALAELASAAMADTEVGQLVLIGADTDGETLGFADFLGEPMAEQVPVEASDLVALPYSSGTTGLSKGVMLTHGNLVANLCQMTGVGIFDGEDDVVDAVLPFFHIYGMNVLMNGTLSNGGTLVMLPRFDLEQFLTMHQEQGVTVSFLAPPIVLGLAKHPIVDNYDLTKLRYMMSGAAPLSAELAAEAAGRLDTEVAQGYGMTELSPVSHTTPPGQTKLGSVGVTVPNTETAIVDPETLEHLGVDAEGEVWVRGPQVMAGYLNNEAATKATITDDGWLRTGDLGRIDADGHLFIADRLKELIKFKGFQVPPAELEGLLLTHPAVADAAVIGKPDDEAGEIPIGFITLKPGVDATADEVREFVNGQVAHYKHLGELSLIESIPKSASGKILRRELRDQA